jgi:hypothetical protein
MLIVTLLVMAQQCNGKRRREARVDGGGTTGRAHRATRRSAQAARPGIMPERAFAMRDRTTESREPVVARGSLLRGTRAN